MLSVYTIMEIIKSKRGRPATGRAFEGKVFMRVPLELEEEAKNRIKALLAERGMKTPTRASKGLESKGMGGYGPVVDAAYKKISDDLKDKCLDVIKPDVELTLLKREVDVAKDQEKKAWDEVERLQREVERLEGAAREFNDKEMSWYVSDENEKVRWMAGLLKKAKMGGNPYDQGEGSC